MAELTLTFTAGALVRGAIKQTIQQACDLRQLTTVWYEHWGFLGLDTDYLLRVRGTNEQMMEFQGLLNRYIAALRQPNVELRLDVHST